MPEEVTDGSAAAQAEPRPAAPGLRRNIWALGVSALFNDIASEMAYWVLPYFLTTLGAGPGWLGLIEGVAESAASGVKIASGRWADRTGRRKPLVVAGYLLANIMKPLLGFTQAAGQVLAVRSLERSAKGLRAAPRDVMITESAAPGQVGAAFGLRQALDSAGAVMGPALAFWLMLADGQDARRVFWAAAIPGAIAVAIVWRMTRETGTKPLKKLGAGGGAGVAPTAAAETSAVLPVGTPGPAARFSPAAGTTQAGLPAALWLLILAAGLFGLANFSDMFLILRAQSVGVAPAFAPLLGLVFNAVFAALSYPLGQLSDRWARKWLVGGGYLVFAAVYWGFGRVRTPHGVWPLFALYGVFEALTAGVLSALIADHARPENRGRAFGWVAGVSGITGFAASALAGGLWHWRGAALPFEVAAVLAVAAAAVMFALPIPKRMLQ